MSMFGVLPLTGAYRRDYKSKAAIVKDWLAGKDFRTAGGQYCSIRDFPANEPITVRYAGLMKVTVFISGTGK